MLMIFVSLPPSLPPSPHAQLPILSLSDMNLEGLDETEHQTEEIVFTLTCEDEEETGAEKGVAIKEEPDSIPGS